MNRQLKFRVWDKLAERMIYPHNDNQQHFIIDLNGRFHNLQNGSGGDDYVIQQYTGLTDSNDKEIYEGDIIHLKFGELNANLVVKWDKYMGLKYHNGGWTSLVHVDTHGEVIGNIFENPELPN